MLLIGENIHILSKEIQTAIETRNPEPIQILASQQEKAGADYLDLNLGPLSNNPVETIEWVVNTVQEVVDLPLSIDTTNSIAMEAGLKICKMRPVINAVNCTQDSRENMIPLAAKYPADMILLIFNEKGVPGTSEERAESILDTIDYANKIGIPTDNIWIDGVLYPICTNQEQVMEYIEFIKIIGDVVPGAKTVTKITDVSSCGVPEMLQGVLNQTLLVILKRYGQFAGIVDMLDQKLVSLNRGKFPDLVKLIHRTINEEKYDHTSLSKEEIAYVKTTNVLLGREIYSHSWLEI